MKDVAGEYKKPKGINKNVDAGISHEEYEDVLLNKICMRHEVNRIKNSKVGIIDKINKIS